MILTFKLHWLEHGSTRIFVMEFEGAKTGDITAQYHVLYS